jgi:hypothetical protein
MGKHNSPNGNAILQILLQLLQEGSPSSERSMFQWEGAILSEVFIDLWLGPHQLCDYPERVSFVVKRVVRIRTAFFCCGLEECSGVDVCATHLWQC